MEAPSPWGLTSWRRHHGVAHRQSAELVLVGFRPVHAGRGLVLTLALGFRVRVRVRWQAGGLGLSILALGLGVF